MNNPLNILIKNSLANAKDFNDRARIKLIFRVWLAFTLLLSVLEVVLIIGKDSVGLIYPVSTGLIVCYLLGLLIRFSKFKILGYFLVYGGFTIVTGAIFLTINPLPIDGALWLVVFTVLSFFILGKKSGIFFTYYSFISYAIYVLFVIDENLKVYEYNKVDDSVYFTVIAIIAVNFLLIQHIIVSFLNGKKDIEKNLRLVNDELRSQNSIIEAQNKEKTLMMQEIHHRVKNNLQVINSLLRIQSYKLVDEKSQEVFIEAQNRIIAMSLIHEEMYRNKSLNEINFEEYIQNLSSAILSNNRTGKEINIIVNSEISAIDNKTMVPLGLIINELIMNSIKHGFDNLEGNEIKLLFTFMDKGKETCIVMDYYDNGVGFNPKEVNRETSFGLEMIEALSDQMEASFTILSASVGVHMSLEFN